MEIARRTFRMLTADRVPDFSRVFMGYRRQRTRPGTRNELWLIPVSTECAGEARRLAALYHLPYWIDAIRVAGSGIGPDLSQNAVRAVGSYLTAVARDPNAAGVMMITMDGTRPTADDIMGRAGLDPAMGRVKSFDIAAESEEQFFLRMDRLASDAPRVREAFSISELRVGVWCSVPDDPTSHAAASVVGRVTDDLVESGASMIFAGLSDMACASDQLLARVIDRRVRDRLVAALDRTRPTAISDAAAMHTGSSIISRVIELGEMSSGEGGVQISTAPAGRERSSLVAAGAQLILVTSPRPKSSGTFVPTINLLNAASTARGPEWADMILGDISTEEDAARAASRLASLIIETASGRYTKSELRGTATFEPLL